MTPLTVTEQETLWQALNDAIAYRLGRLTGCAGCDAAERAGGAYCDRHRGDYEQTDRYHDLGRAAVAKGLAHAP